MVLRLSSVRVALTSAVCLTLLFSSPPALPQPGVPAPAPTVPEKLAHQWQRYHRAQQLLIRKVAAGGRVTRREWEALLQPQGRFRWTADDLSRLQRDQQARIRAQAEEARRLSPIDLDMVRESGRAAEFCRALPKGGMLHVHPTGTLYPATVARLLARANPRVDLNRIPARQAFAAGELDFLRGYPPGTRYRSLSRADRARFRDLFVMPAESTDFRRFDAVFALVGMLERSPRVDAWEVLFNDFFARARRQGVRYVEFTTGVNPTEGALRDLERLARRARSRYGIVVRVNTAFNRAAPPAENRESLRRLAGLLSRRRGSVIVGIDLLGPEAGHPALEAGQLLYGQVLGSRAWRGRFRRTFHAAGVGEIRNLRDALLLGAERVGHGSRWLEDSVSLELAAAQRTGVEVNLVSSVRLGYAPGYVEHPMLDLLRLGLRVSLSTDDEGIFATDLANEFEMAVTHTEITYHELKQLVYHSIGTAFVDDERKARMLRELDAELARFEAEWGLHAPGQAAPRAWSLFRLPETPRAAFRERG